MDDNITVLVDAKTEYTKQLTHILVPYILEGIKSIYETSKSVCKLNNDNNVLMRFQEQLSQIPKWNQEIIDEEYTRIVENSGCDWLDELITAVFLSHTKILTSIKSNKKQNKINLKIPKIDHFIHKCYIESAREIWKNPYLFNDKYNNCEYQRNQRDCNHIISESIEETIRKLLPVKSILKEYLGETNDEDCLVPEQYRDNLRKLVKKELELVRNNGEDLNLNGISEIIKEDIEIETKENNIKSKIKESKKKEPKTKEPKTKEPKIEELKLEELKLEEPEIKDLNIEELKLEEPEIKELNIEELKIDELNIEEPKIKELEIKELKIEEPEIKEFKIDEPEIKELKIEEPQIKELKIEEPQIKELKLEIEEFNEIKLNDKENISCEITKKYDNVSEIDLESKSNNETNTSEDIKDINLINNIINNDLYKKELDIDEPELSEIKLDNMNFKKMNIGDMKVEELDNLDDIFNSEKEISKTDSDISKTDSDISKTDSNISKMDGDSNIKTIVIDEDRNNLKKYTKEKSKSFRFFE